jgi:hypothetical protein
MRHLFEFDEPCAKCVVVVDVERKPRKSISKDTPRDLPHVQALVKMIGDYIGRECSADTAVAV